MNNNPLVTVIIPVYNTENYLQSCFDSVVNQTYDKLQIIIVDDGSTDNSKKIIKQYSNIDERVEVFFKENGGASSARNVGLEIIKGKYVTFIDSDDWWELNAIEELVREIEKNKFDIVMPQSYVKVTDNNIKKHENLFDEHDKNSNVLEFVSNTMIGKARAWRVSSVIYKSDIIKNNNIKFPEGYTAEDFVFNLDFLNKASKIGFLKKITLNVNERKGSVTSSYRDDLPELALYLDKIVKNFYLDKDINSEFVILLRDSLLRRNIILFLISELSHKNLKSKEEIDIRIDEVMSDKRVIEAFNNKKFITPYWNNKYKIRFVELIERLLYYKKIKLALNLIKLANRIRST